MKARPVDSIPRNRAWLQFSAERWTDGVQVDYELVIPLQEVDCRGTFDHKPAKDRPKSHRMVWLDANNCKRIPLGRTKVGTTNPEYPFSARPGDEGQIDLPFRDGAHAGWDGTLLGDPELYYQVDGKTYRLTKS